MLSVDVLDPIYGSQYILLRSDWNFDLMAATRGGSMLIAVFSHLLHYSIDLSCISQAFLTIDLLGLKVRFRGSCFCIFTVYTPPGTAFDLYDDLFERSAGATFAVWQ